MQNGPVKLLDVVALKIALPTGLSPDRSELSSKFIRQRLLKRSFWMTMDTPSRS